MRKVINLLGKSFGRLTVIERGENDNSEGARWECKCTCGNTSLVRGTCLRSGRIVSCGCYHSEKTSEKGKSRFKHRMIDTPTYNTWSLMKNRCNSKTSRDYIHYGNRGITVCSRWSESFECFLEDMGEKPEGKSIDRIDNNAGYKPSNCRWATSSEQGRNKRTTKLSIEVARAIRKDSRKYKDIASEYGVSTSCVGAVKRNETWKGE